MTTEDLMKLRELTEAATPGPWIAGDDEDSDYFLVGPPSFDAVVTNPVVTLHALCNAEFIAAANPAKIIELLDALEAQGREVARLREVNAEQYGALDLAARECTTLRAELAAIRAQEPVIDFTVLYQFASDQAISYNKLCTAVRMAVASPKIGGV